MRELFWMTAASVMLVLAGASAEEVSPMLEAEVMLPSFLTEFSL